MQVPAGALPVDSSQTAAPATVSTTSQPQQQFQLVAPPNIQGLNPFQMVATSGSAPTLQFSNPTAGMQQVVRPAAGAALPQQLAVNSGQQQIQGVLGQGQQLGGTQLVTLPGGQQALVRCAAPQMVQVGNFFDFKHGFRSRFMAGSNFQNWNA